MRIALAALLIAGCATAPSPKPLVFDHLLVFVSPGAPERAAFERAGFRIDPTINEHEGQGTASVTVEFENAFLELIWPDPKVPVSPDLERAVEKFRKRSAWRTSGWSPFGVAMHRNGPPVEWPVPTWSIAPPWLAPGEAIVMLTPRDDASSPSLSVHADKDEPPRDTRHPIGVRRVTGVRLITPESYEPIDALKYVRDAGVLTFDRGSEWLVELTFDNGRRHETKDLRPDLPLRIRY